MENKLNNLERIRLKNATNKYLDLILEPDGMSFEMPPASLFEIVFEEPDDFEVEIVFEEDSISGHNLYTVYGKYPATVFCNGVKIYPDT